MERKKLMPLFVTIIALSAFIGGAVGAQWLELILSEVGVTHTREAPIIVISEVPDYTASSCTVEGDGFDGSLIIDRSYVVTVSFSHFRTNYLISDTYTLEAIQGATVDTLATGTIPELKEDEVYEIVANWIPTIVGDWILKFVADDFVWTEIVYVYFNEPILSEVFKTGCPAGFTVPTISAMSLDASYYDVSSPATLSYTVNNVDAYYKIKEYDWEILVGGVVVASGSYVGEILNSDSLATSAGFNVPDAVGYYDLTLRVTVTLVENT